MVWYRQNRFHDKINAFHFDSNSPGYRICMFSNPYKISKSINEYRAWHDFLFCPLMTKVLMGVIQILPKYII